MVCPPQSCLRPQVRDAQRIIGPPYVKIRGPFSNRVSTKKELGMSRILVLTTSDGEGEFGMIGSLRNLELALPKRMRMFAAFVSAAAVLASFSPRLTAQCAGEAGNSLGFDMAPETSQRVVEDAVRQIPIAMAPGPLKPTWDSLKENYKVPDWFKGAKFGIFIHFGIFSVPAHGNEWYEKYLYAGGNDSVLKVLGGNDLALGANNGPNGTRAWHTEHFGLVDKFGYKDFIPMFKAEHFDADAWAELFKKAGARFVVPGAEHHENFAM